MMSQPLKLSSPRLGRLLGFLVVVFTFLLTVCLALALMIRVSVAAPTFPGGNGAYWGTYDGSRAFFNKDKTLFASQATGVVDVSSHQETVDWAKVKASGVQGAIIRLGNGWDGGTIDRKALTNISECQRLGIPFGVYFYSFAPNAAAASTEGAKTVAFLKQAKVSTKTAYPIFYDLENFQADSSGRKPPTTASVYRSIIDKWSSQLKQAGYTNLGVYAYTSYLNGPLKDPAIWAQVRWVAEWGPKLHFNNFATAFRGWQYSNTGTIPGISGSVDLNAFGSMPSQPVYRLYNPNTGEHFYTTSAGERNYDISVGWRDEGTLEQAPVAGSPVYRVFNPNAPGGDHYYTLQKSEATSLVNQGWKWDNRRLPVFNAGGGTKVYVAYNPNARSGAHNYTTNAAEQQNLLRIGWIYGKTAWWAAGVGGK